MTPEPITRTSARRHAGRAGLLALAATTAVGMAVPAAQAAQAASPPTVAPGARVPMAPAMTYRVQSGDTVSHIALRTGSSVGAIIAANNLGPRGVIRPGQMLRVPATTSATTVRAVSAPARTSAPAAGVHTVRAGETVSGIARSYRTTVAAIAAANSLASPDRIRVGQRLTVTGAPTPLAPAPVAAPVSAPVSAGTHTVRAGETLSGIAARYRTSVPALVAANSLASANRIYAGQVLRLGVATPVSNPVQPVPVAPAPTAPAPVAPAPVAPAAGSYTVKAGDTVSGLARSWGTTVAAVVAANNLRSAGLIYIGQRLTVPGSATAAPAPSAPATGALVPSTFLGRTYPEATVAAANANKATLLATGVPSRAHMQALVVQVAQQMGVDPALAQAHAYQESGFNHASVSPANAIGTMQVIPSSGEWASSLVGRKLNLLDPHDNVVAGVAIIRQLVRTSPDLDSAIAGYYQGAGSVKRNGMFADTKTYVASVRAHMARF